MLQIGDKNQQFVIDTRYINPQIFKDIVEDKKIVKVGANLKFD